MPYYHRYGTITGGTSMTIIPCNENCVYQSDGYCKLESASIVTDCTVSGCMHKIEPHTTVIRQEPQRHL